MPLPWTTSWPMTEARSGGQIVFPWVSRRTTLSVQPCLYRRTGNGLRDRNAVLWLERGLVTTDLQTDWLAARSPDRFWVMLMNQTRARRTVRVQSIPQRAASPPATAFCSRVMPIRSKRLGRLLPVLLRRCRRAPSRSRSRRSRWSRSVIPPPRARSSASQPLATSHRTAPPVRSARPTLTIRSPWGKDAVYAVLTADPISGARVVFTCDGQTRVCERFPYEASFYPVSAPGAAVRIVTHLPGQPESVIALP